MNRMTSMLASALVITVLASCSDLQGRQEYVPEQGGPGYGGGGPGSSTNVVPGGPGPASGSSGQAGMIRGSADDEGMCELHRRIMAARTPEERQALMDRYMQGMSPEVRQRHLQMMQERCR